MDVSTEAGVVGQVPAGVIGVFVDDHVVRVPEPAVGEGNIIGSYAEVEAAEPEASRAAADQMPMMVRTEAAVEVAMAPGVVEVIVGVVTAGVMADPAGAVLIVINVGCVGVALVIVVVAMFLRRVGGAVELAGPVRGRRLMRGRCRMLWMLR